MVAQGIFTCMLYGEGGGCLWYISAHTSGQVGGQNDNFFLRVDLKLLYIDCFLNYIHTMFLHYVGMICVVIITL